MSLIGIDVGSSAVKATAYRVSGGALASAHTAVPSVHPEPGHAVVDGDQVWAATVRVVRRLTAHPKLRRDPPQALAVSASGRESFLARADGSALGPCLRTADARRPRLEATDILRLSAEEWIRECGHVPDHRDPTNRLLWWRETDPKTLSEARWFLGWHELISLKLVGLPLIDPALAAGFLLFDLSSRNWSDARIESLGIDRRLLPEIVPWANVFATIDPAARRKLGLPDGCHFVVGSWDGSCAAVGAAVVDEGAALIAAGTWESVVAPVANPRSHEAAEARLAITPQPSTPGLGIWARSPNGTNAAEWARSLAGVGFRELEVALIESGNEPAAALVVPHFSGVSPPWPENGHPAAAILGLTLATSPIEIVKATYEGIAFDLTFAIEALGRAGSPITLCRVAGGGSRSPWWMQLKADLLDVPVEVSDQEEPGTLGAALLAGVGISAYRTLAEATELVKIARRYEPDRGRRARYQAKLARHRRAVESLVESPAPSAVAT